MRKKIVIFILVFSLGFSLPLYSGRSAGAIAYISKEFGLDLIARALARRFLSSLTSGIVKSVNKLGTENNRQAPTFVQNWKKFLADSQASGENQFRAQLGYTITNSILCNDFQNPLATIFQASQVPPVDIGAFNINAELKQHTLLPYQTRIRCTVPTAVRDTFKNDFIAGGGWNTWSRLIQPQNNFAGALSLSMEELTKQRTAQELAQRSEATGQGFKGVKNNCQGAGANLQCAFLGEIVTPAQILSKGAAQFIDDNGKWLTSSDELSEVLMSILGSIMGNLADFAGKQVANSVVGATAKQITDSLDNPNPVQSSTNTAGQPATNLLPAAQADQAKLNAVARQNCIDACVAPKNQACDSDPTLVATQQLACRNNALSACNQQCP